MTRRALLVHNPAAGRGGRDRRVRLEHVCRVLGRAGITADLAETGAPGDAVTLGRRASTDGYAFAFVCGGDGTLNEVVNGLVGAPCARTVAVGVLPAGTANILARELGVPDDIGLAAERLAAAATRRIALGLATPVQQPDRKRYFVCVAGAGPDGEIVRSVDLALKRRIGVLAYWWQGAIVAARYPFPRFRATSAETSVDATFVTVGRTRRYGGPFVLTGDASLADDTFEVLALATRSRAAYLSYVPRACRGTLRGRGVHRWKTDAVLCSSDTARSIYAHVDGEPLGSLPVRFSIVPDALTIVTPAAEARS